MKQLTVGGFGSVSVGDTLKPQMRVFGEKIIIKTILAKELNERQKSMFNQEVSLMYYLRAEKHIAKIVGYCTDPYALLMKFYPMGSLDNWLGNETNVKTRRILIQFAIDIASGIGAMHRNGFAHCDLKSANILVDTDFVTKRSFCVLTDFGISQILTQKTLLVDAFHVTNVQGISLNYAAPEAFQRFRMRRNEQLEAFTIFTSDVYSFGVILLEVVCRRTAKFG